MGVRYLSLVAALLVAERSWCLPAGCVHGGRAYGEGEVVEAGEPCLSCVCRRGALGCRQRVCGDYVERVPSGCVVVRRAGECCPELLCGGGVSWSGIEVRSAEGRSERGCVINGTTYGEGSAVGSGDPCEYCYCGEEGLKCVRPRCVAALEGCRAVYEDSSCCPTGFDCRGTNVRMVESEGLEESTTESRTESTTETGEGSTVDVEEETTTAGGSSDPPTTLSFQTSGDGESGGGGTEETREEVTSEVEGRRPVTEGVEERWNASEDYDAYDYGEPKLPPSLPNLVIFPFVAADAVVKDDLREEVQVDRMDDQPVVFKDHFSPPTRTEGGFVPKEPFYEVPFRKEPLSEEKQTALQINAPPEAPKDDASLLDDGTDLTSGSGSKGMLQEELFSEDVPDRKSQQKPVTVAYKNVVVDFYPDYLVTTTRTLPGDAPQHQTTPNIPLDPLFGFPDKATLPPTAELPPKPTTPPPDHSPSLQHFLETFLTDTNAPSALSASKHKYSSKIKTPATTASPPVPSSARTPPAAPQPSGSTLLKLAGCNIYGMMYRIGKVIAELSGPCVQCLCTDLGVQCSPLEC